MDKIIYVILSVVFVFTILYIGFYGQNSKLDLVFDTFKKIGFWIGSTIWKGVLWIGNFIKSKFNK